MKQDYKIKSTETIELGFWAIRNSKGEFYGNSGFYSDISKAKIYSTPGPAKTLITKMMGREWNKITEAPDLVHIVSGVCNFIDQEERTNISVKQAKINRLNNEIKRYKKWNKEGKDNYWDFHIEKLKKQLEDAKK